MEFPHPPAIAQSALDGLLQLDPHLASIVERAGPLPWRTRTPGFPGLLQAIVAQMISNQAAAAIWGRTRVLPGALDPLSFLDLTEEQLRGAGFSRPKVGHARALAEAFVDGRLSTAGIAAMDDEEAVRTL